MFWFFLFAQWQTFLAELIVFFFFCFFDLKRSCRNCGSRFSEIIVHVEVAISDKTTMTTKTKWRRCLWCGDRMLYNKKLPAICPSKEGQEIAIKIF
jgi:hypothetical protein